eukprot:gene836-1043_t
MIPEGTKYVEFGLGCFTLLEGCLPHTVTNISIEGIIKDLSPGTIPPSTKYLFFGDNVQLEQDLMDLFPQDMKCLNLGSSFNRPLQPGYLPEGLESLTLGFFYNHPIPPNTLPQSLKGLELSEHFNQSLGIGVLPESLESITFGKRFNQRLEVPLPMSLKFLGFGKRFNQLILPDVLPQGLEFIEFGGDFCIEKCLVPGSIPSNVKVLKFSNNDNVDSDYLLTLINHNNNNNGNKNVNIKIILEN